MSIGMFALLALFIFIVLTCLFLEKVEEPTSLILSMGVGFILALYFGSCLQEIKNNIEKFPEEAIFHSFDLKDSIEMEDNLDITKELKVDNNIYKIIGKDIDGINIVMEIPVEYIEFLEGNNKIEIYDAIAQYESGLMYCEKEIVYYKIYVKNLEGIGEK